MTPISVQPVASGDGEDNVPMPGRRTEGAAKGSSCRWRSRQTPTARLRRAPQPSRYATYGSAPVSLTIGRSATAQPVMPSDTFTVFQPAPASAWAA
jgi:hypothetical protein